MATSPLVPSRSKSPPPKVISPSPIIVDSFAPHFPQDHHADQDVDVVSTVVVANTTDQDFGHGHGYDTSTSPFPSSSTLSSPCSSLQPVSPGEEGVFLSSTSPQHDKEEASHLMATPVESGLTLPFSSMVNEVARFMQRHDNLPDVHQSQGDDRCGYDCSTTSMIHQASDVFVGQFENEKENGQESLVAQYERRSRSCCSPEPYSERLLPENDLSIVSPTPIDNISFVNDASASAVAGAEIITSKEFFTDDALLASEAGNGDQNASATQSPLALSPQHLSSESTASPTLPLDGASECSRIISQSTVSSFAFSSVWMLQEQPQSQPQMPSATVSYGTDSYLPRCQDFSSGMLTSSVSISPISTSEGLRPLVSTPNEPLTPVSPFRPGFDSHPQQQRQQYYPQLCATSIQNSAVETVASSTFSSVSHVPYLASTSEGKTMPISTPVGTQPMSVQSPQQSFGLPFSSSLVTSTVSPMSPTYLIRGYSDSAVYTGGYNTSTTGGNNDFVYSATTPAFYDTHRRECTPTAEDTLFINQLHTNPKFSRVQAERKEFERFQSQQQSRSLTSQSATLQQQSQYPLQQQQNSGYHYSFVHTPPSQNVQQQQTPPDLQYKQHQHQQHHLPLRSSSLCSSSSSSSTALYDAHGNSNNNSSTGMLFNNNGGSHMIHEQQQQSIVYSPVMNSGAPSETPLPLPSPYGMPLHSTAPLALQNSHLASTMSNFTGTSFESSGSGSRRLAKPSQSTNTNRTTSKSSKNRKKSAAKSRTSKPTEHSSSSAFLQLSNFSGNGDGSGFDYCYGSSAGPTTSLSYSSMAQYRPLTLVKDFKAGYHQQQPTTSSADQMVNEGALVSNTMTTAPYLHAAPAPLTKRQQSRLYRQQQQMGQVQMQQFQQQNFTQGDYDYSNMDHTHSGDNLFTMDPRRRLKREEPEELKICANCHISDAGTPTWRRCSQNTLLLCNACGLYEKTHKRQRPFYRTNDGQTKVQRTSAKKDKERAEMEAAATAMMLAAAEAQAQAQADQTGATQTTGSRNGGGGAGRG